MNSITGSACCRGSDVPGEAGRAGGEEQHLVRGQLRLEGSAGQSRGQQLEPDRRLETVGKWLGETQPRVSR